MIYIFHITAHVQVLVAIIVSYLVNAKMRKEINKVYISLPPFLTRRPAPSNSTRRWRAWAMRPKPTSWRCGWSGTHSLDRWSRSRRWRFPANRYRQTLTLDAYPHLGCLPYLTLDHHPLPLRLFFEPVSSSQRQVPASAPSTPPRGSLPPAAPCLETSFVA